MSINKTRIINAFNNQKTDRIPVSFWFHHVEEAEYNGGKKIIPINIEGHKRYIQQIHCDCIKIMSDGYHQHPALFNECQPVRTVEDLKKIKNLSKDHVWITSQIDIARRVVDIDKDLAYFYNMFSPVYHLEFIVGGRDNLAKLLNENPGSVAECLDVLAHDVALLCTELLNNSGVDGIYFSVANPALALISDSTYKSYVEPSDLYVLRTINAIKDFNILHVCGYDGKRNHLQTFSHYPTKAVNWATHVEGVSLAEGKKLFGGRCVIGGFANSPGTLLHTGAKEDIEREVEKIIADTGRVGIVVGADCALPFGIDTQRIKWVIDKAYSL